MDKNKNIKSPEKLYEYFEAYKLNELNDPVISTHYNVKTNTTGKVNHLRPLTTEGFSVYLFKQGITSNLMDYVQNVSNNYDNYSYIVRMIKAEIFRHNLSGAAVGEYQHNIIARQLGMVDKVENVVKVEPASIDEIQKELDRLIIKAKDSL